MIGALLAAALVLPPDVPPATPDLRPVATAPARPRSLTERAGELARALRALWPEAQVEAAPDGAWVRLALPASRDPAKDSGALHFELQPAQEVSEPVRLTFRHFRFQGFVVDGQARASLRGDQFELSASDLSVVPPEKALRPAAEAAGAAAQAGAAVLRTGLEVAMALLGEVARALARVR